MNYNNDNTQKKLSPFGIVTAVFLAGFLIATYILFNTGKNTAGVFAVGIAILAGGVLFSDLFNAWRGFGWFITGIGIIISAVASVYLWGDFIFGVQTAGAIRAWFKEYGISLASCGGFTAIGLIISLGTLISGALKKKRCSVEIQAVCVEVIERRPRSSDESTTYLPIFSYHYDGQDYRVSSGYYSSIDIPTVDHEYALRINPDKPSEFYREKNGNRTFVVIFGFIFTAVGIYSLISSMI